MYENEIPADIIATAGCIFEYWMKTADVHISELIACALLAERLATEKRVREECAKVVECFIPASQDRLSEQIAELCAIIAAAIRGGSRE